MLGNKIDTSSYSTEYFVLFSQLHYTVYRADVHFKSALLTSAIFRFNFYTMNVSNYHIKVHDLCQC